MAKKGLIIFVLTVFLVGAAFAQGTPKNTITVDFGPTIVGAAFGAIGGMIGDEGDASLNSSGFGIAAQYELQPFNRLSFAVRGAYLGFGFGITEQGWDYSVQMDMGMTSFSVEGHARLYPFAGSFFLDGMGGYGRLMADLDGEVAVYDGGRRDVEYISLGISRDYIKLGGKLGWRFSFGKSGGGFTFEPSFGYYHAIGLGDTLGSQLSNQIDGEIEDFEDYDDAFVLFERFIFIGGPRVSLAFGFRF